MILADLSLEGLETSSIYEIIILSYSDLAWLAESIKV